MDFENDVFISREILIRTMRQAARYRPDRLIPWSTVYEIIMNCPTKEQIDSEKRENCYE